MNVLLLGAGQNHVDIEGESYPLCLMELDGRSVLEHIIETYLKVDENISFIFTFNENDIKQYRLDNVVKQLCPTAKVISVGNTTKGAACTALLAVNELNESDSLIIQNISDILDIDVSSVLKNFDIESHDVATIIFKSVHPRYSYIRLNKVGKVVEAAEKNPISKNAIAGFYWFKEANLFVEGAKAMIRKDAHIDGQFYISPVLNEMILTHKSIGYLKINKDQYNPLKSEYQFKNLKSKMEYGGLYE